ncbi:MAG TPA: OmpA family protein [Brumimicrobium sp.]|nr:OmpA family protein [Brumimicrobium sp.]
MKKLLFLIPALILYSGINAQLKQKSADDYFELEQYYKAAPIYEELSNKSIKKNQTNWQYVRRTAESYSLLNRNNKSSDFYAILNQNDQLTEADFIAYIQVLKTLSRYPMAFELTEKGAKKYPENKILTNWFKKQGSLNRLYNDMSNNSVTETNLNSGNGDFSPVFFDNGIVYCTKSIQKGFLVGKTGWDNTNYIRLMYAEEVDSSESQHNPKLLKGAFFSRLHNGPIAFDSTETQMVITQNIRNKEDKAVYLALFFSSKTDNGTWGELVPFPFNKESYNVGHATFSPDQKGIYFVSDEPGGFGGTDLYYSEKKNGAWQEPINLGESINTELDELFPYVNQENVLYFSSNGHFGLGGLDIFKIKLSEDDQKPTNLGHPINSSADDFGIIEHEINESGYFSSNRDGFIDNIYFWKGGRDFDRYYNYRLLGNIFNAETKERVEGASVNIVMNGETDDLSSNNDGKYTSHLIDTMKFGDNVLISIVVKKKGYLPQTITVDKDLGKEDKLKYDFNLHPFDIGEDLSKILKLAPIYYDLDKATLREESKTELDKVAAILNDNPEMIIELGSHTDCRQTYSYNMTLSEKRAKSAAEYLKSRIVNPQRIIPIGYGELKLVNDCSCEGDVVSDCSEEEHQENRRTEFIIIKK